LRRQERREKRVVSIKAIIRFITAPVKGKNNVLPAQTPDFAFFSQKNTKTLDFERSTFDDSPPLILSSSRRIDFNVFSERDIFPDFTR